MGYILYSVNLYGNFYKGKTINILSITFIIK